MLDKKHILLSASSFVTPNDVYLLNIETKELTNLTEINLGHPALDSLSLPEKFFFPGNDGQITQGFVFKPSNFEKGK